MTTASRVHPVLVHVQRRRRVRVLCYALSFALGVVVGWVLFGVLQL